MGISLGLGLGLHKHKFIKSNIKKAFIIKVDSTENGVSNNNQFQFTGGQGNYDVVAKQNDVIIKTFNNLSGEETITFATAGVYDLEITPKPTNGFNRIRFYNSGDKDKIKDIKQWGTIKWSSFGQAFHSCFNMLTTATDAPNLSIVTDMGEMFRSAKIVNPDTSDWNVSNVIFMELLFFDTDLANPDVSTWNMSNVIDTNRMFYYAIAATPDTTNWNVSKITNMFRMFTAAVLATPNVTNWDTRSLINASKMFERADLSNPDCSNWDISNVTEMKDMFESSNLSTENLTACYKKWSKLILQQNVLFSAGDIKYNNSGQAGKNLMINDYNWSIIDGGNAFQGMLDLFPNGSFAVSHRKLKADYADDSTVVRNDNSNQLGIGFADNELDQTSLLSFTGSGDGFGVELKDQTGNGRNFLQSSASSQPKIVSNGSVILANGKPTLFYNGSKDHLRLSAKDFCTPTDKLQVSVIAKNAKSNIGSNEYIIGQYGSGQDERSWALLIGNDKKLQINFGNPENGRFQGAYKTHDSITTEDLQTIGFTFDSGTVVIYLNSSIMSGSSAAGGIPTSLFNSSADVTIGSVLSNNVAVALWNGNISEIYLADNLTDNIIEIQQNQIV
jgi:hypothetical protein